MDNIQMRSTRSRRWSLYSQQRHFFWVKLLVACCVGVIWSLWSMRWLEILSSSSSSSLNNCDCNHFLPPPLVVKQRHQEQNTTNNVSSKENNESSTTTTATTNTTIIEEIPVVIISALRPAYLEQVMVSLQHQNIHTPSWIAQSRRYLFVHVHAKNNIGTNYQQVLDLAQQYKFQVVPFVGLYAPQVQMNVNANFAWYKMMRYLFQKARVEEALILEDDAVLAPDALMVAAKLFRAKKTSMPHVHAICLGGWSGQNKINPNPQTYLAVRQQYFQAMAYSMNATLFRQIEQKKKKKLLYTAGLAPDWTEEITTQQFIKNLIMLSPSVGRMKHIGAHGMGPSGTGTGVESSLLLTNNGNHTGPTRVIEEGNPWDPWQDQISRFPNSNKTNNSISIMDDYYYLDPPEVTDLFGFICSPIRFDCGRALYKPGALNANLTRRPDSPYQLLPEHHALLGPPLPVISAKASSSLGPLVAKMAVDKDLFTRWASEGGVPQWISIDLGQSYPLSSVTLAWETAFASSFDVQIIGNSYFYYVPFYTAWQTVHRITDGKGQTEFFNLTGYSGRHVRIICYKTASESDDSAVQAAAKWGISLWEITIRGVTKVNG